MSIKKLSKHKNKTIIALTGGIASGKSYACDFFETQGLSVIKLDEINTYIYDLETTQDYLRKTFQTTDKKIIKHIVFKDKNKLTQLENYLQPRVLECMQQRIQGLQGNIIVEIPLLFEKKLYHHFDSAIVILSTPQLQIQRMLSRDTMSQEVAENILKNQATNAQRKEISQHLPTIFIENNQSVTEFKKALSKAELLLLNRL